MLQRADEPGRRELQSCHRSGDPPGGTSGRHRHPGIELAYVLEGSVVINVKDEAPVTVKAGEALKNEAAVHNAKESGQTPL